MPKSAEELEKMILSFQEKQEQERKDFELKLKSLQTNADQWKAEAEKREEELRKFRENSVKEEKARKEAEATAKEAEVKEFVESLTKAGRIPPSIKDSVTAFMKSLASDTQSLEFAEKDGSTRTLTKFILFKNILQALKPVVPVGTEFTTHDPAAGAAIETVETTDGEEHFVEVLEEGVKKKMPVKGVDLAAKAFEYIETQRKAGITVSYYDALLAVSPKNTAIRK